MSRVPASQAGINPKQLIARCKAAGGYTTDSGAFIRVVLPASSPVIKLLQRIRDESHRFAAAYHDLLKRSRQTSSLLDNIPGVGFATRKKLVRHFGSTRGVLQATPEELVEVLGTKRAQKVWQYLKSNA